MNAILKFEFSSDHCQPRTTLLRVKTSENLILLPFERQWHTLILVFSFFFENKHFFTETCVNIWDSEESSKLSFVSSYVDDDHMLMMIICWWWSYVDDDLMFAGVLASQLFGDHLLLRSQGRGLHDHRQVPEQCEGDADHVGGQGWRQRGVHLSTRVKSPAPSCQYQCQCSGADRLHSYAQQSRYLLSTVVYCFRLKTWSTRVCLWNIEADQENCLTF